MKRDLRAWDAVRLAVEADADVTYIGTPQRQRYIFHLPAMAREEVDAMAGRLWRLIVSGPAEADALTGSTHAPDRYRAGVSFEVRSGHGSSVTISVVDGSGPS